MEPAPETQDLEKKETPESEKKPELSDDEVLNFVACVGFF